MSTGETPTTGSVESLASHMAIKANNQMLWEPIDMLRHVLKKIESGEIKPINAAVYMAIDIGDGKVVYVNSQAKMTGPNLIAMLELGKRWAMKEWMPDAP